ncbi:alpha/beta hydrolase [Actinomadura graeca]|uniref:Alpha/beta hydrolase n=1 Tax=Actinomadura graeca TaxID=2750812 RepID=A0ABX8QS92_9ACTN|nr:alpha/beta hydrolase [Actinomadura graeca]QXJ19673.1 alpha/beta hydrolase [Actinomadura graeca]
MTLSDDTVKPAPPDVLWRAMPPTRMLDCGVLHADVLALRRATDAGVPWDDAAEGLADARLATADAARAAGHVVTAAESYRAAAADLLFAQMAHNFDTPRKIGLYTRFTGAIAAAGVLGTPAWERVELPFAGGRLFGWLVRPAVPAAGTVIVFGGQSGWGAAYRRQADALAARGLAALLAEGPGQGETRWTGGILIDADVRAAYSTFVSHVRGRPELGPVVGLWGNSLGGLYAATTAASDPRVSAVCVNGAPARPRLLDFRAFTEQAAAMLGTTDPGALRRNFDRIALAPGDRIACPLLVLHGGRDPIVALGDQQPFLDAAAGDAVLRTWDDGEHTIYNHADERTAFVADWFADRFARTPPKE